MVETLVDSVSNTGGVMLPCEDVCATLALAEFSGSLSWRWCSYEIRVYNYVHIKLSIIMHAYS